MNLTQAKEAYLSVREKVTALRLAYYLNSMDVETGIAPPASFPFRGRQLATIGDMIYDMTTSESFMEAVRTLAEAGDALGDPDLLHEARETLSQSEKVAKCPKEEYLAYSTLLNEVYPIYVEAKRTSDFSLFEPYLQKIIDYNRKYVGWVATPERAGYDVLLDEYEKGFGQKEYDAFFDLLKEKLVPLIARIAEKKLVYGDGFTKKLYSAEGQKRFCEYLAPVLCFDRDRTAMLESEHPFTNNNGNHDVRITNHYYEDNLISSIFSAIHEMGHALYELQVDDRFEGTGCGGGASLALHESQSRFMENMVGRSPAFWERHFEALREVFPDELAGVTVEDFVCHVNRVEQSLIRTEADELTYSVHVLIRYELEKEMLSGKLNAKEIPAAWNAKYKEYLGVDVPCDREGCLQDMHWAGGSLGYFPTYALGSAYAAQIWAAMARDLDIEAAIRGTTLKEIAEWLRLHLHRYGSSRDPKELLLLATGEPFDPHYYVDYLTEKYSRLYGIEA